MGASVEAMGGGGQWVLVWRAGVGRIVGVSVEVAVFTYG